MQFQTRTLRIPIAEVDGNKNDFYNDLRSSLQLSVKSMNYLYGCYLSDDKDIFDKNKWRVNPKTGKSTLPLLPEWILKGFGYSKINSFFSGTTSIAAAISREAKQKYCSYRWDIAIGKKSLPTERNGNWPLLRSETKVEYKNESVYLHIKLLNSIWSIRLRGGSNYNRQIGVLKSIIKDVDSKTNFNKIVRLRDSSIWIDKKGRAIIGIAVQFPIKEKDRNGTLKIVSSRDTLLTSIKEQNNIPFTITGDQVKKWKAENIRKQQRLRQDKKKDKSRRSINKLQEQISLKYNNRIDSFIHKVSRQVVDYANRRNIKVVEYNDTIRSYLFEFPWEKLRTQIKNKLEELGIEFQYVSYSIEEPNIEKPHIYFLLELNATTGKPTGVVKIGKTERSAGKRSKEVMNSCIYLSAIETTKSNLTKLEKEYLSQFNDYNLKIEGKKELFQALPIINWLREVGWLGNTGNLSQISQVLEV